MFDNTKNQGNVVNIKNLTKYEFEESNNFDPDLKAYFNEIEGEVFKFKLSACLVMANNLLSKTPNKVVDTITSSKLDKELTFKKIYAEMLNNCVNIIDEVKADKTLRDSVAVVDDISYSKFLKFETARYQIIGPQPTLTEAEARVMAEIQNSIDNPEYEVVKNQSSDDDYTTAHFSISHGRGYYILIGYLLGFLVIVWYLRFKK